MSHTPTPWLIGPYPAHVSAQRHKTGVSSLDGVVAGCAGYMDGQEKTRIENEHNAERIVAAVNFFHSDDGRAIDTDKIEPGGFWEAIQVIDQLRTALDDMTNQLPNDERLADYNFDLAELAEESAIALLDRMGVK